MLKHCSKVARNRGLEQDKTTEEEEEEKYIPPDLLL